MNIMRRFIKVEEFKADKRENLETDSSEDEQEIEDKYEKSKEYVGKLVAENTHLRLMINKYIQVIKHYRLKYW